MTIRRGELQLQLVRAAQVRSLVSLLSLFPAMLPTLLVGSLFQSLNQDLAAIMSGCTLFGIPLLVSSLMTHYYCKRAVRCPQCQASLWSCGSGNFKPRRLKVRDEASACPSCGEPIRGTDRPGKVIS